MSKISIDHQVHENGEISFLPWKTGCEIFKGISQALEAFGDFSWYHIEVITAKPIFSRSAFIKTDIFRNIELKIVILQPFSGPREKIEVKFFLNCHEVTDLANKVSLAIIEQVRGKLQSINNELEKRQKMLQHKIANLPSEVKEG